MSSSLELEELTNVWDTFGIQPSKHTLNSRLGHLATHLNNPPNNIYFTVSELDELVAGDDRKTDHDRIDAAEYMDGFFRVIEWWIAALDIVTAESTSCGANLNSALEAERRHSAEMLDAVLTAYTPALLGTMSFSGGIDTDAHLKLLTNYHLFTRFVCSFAEKVWPNVDFTALRKQF